MNTILSRVILRAVSSAVLLCAAGAASAADITVNLTAQRMSTTLPNGAVVPMWGYCTTGACTSVWAPGPTITAAAGDKLTISLTNTLPAPTSLMILGQLGGGLGSPDKMAGPAHNGQTVTTWPANTAATFTPPAQLQRTLSMGLTVGANTTTALTWNSLKPGTYLYETGTLPSVQAPMGLYGVLVVTQAPATGTSFTPGDAYPPAVSGGLARVPYDADVALLFSEIDPVQNAAVDAAAMAGADPNTRFNGPGCSATSPCYPAAVNYTPTYFLINGHAFNKLDPASSSFGVAGNNAAPGSYATGNVLLRMVNAGLRTHVPTLIGQPMALVAEDGNLAPGNPKLQSEVLLTAGKTHDVVIRPAADTTGLRYAPASYSLFDRHLNLSSGGVPDSGMQGFVLVASVGATSGAGVLPTLAARAVNDSFQVALNAITSGNVVANDVAVTTVQIVNQPAHGTVAMNAAGNFIYTPAADFAGVDSFTYNGNGGTTNTATVTLNVALSSLAGKPTANPDSFGGLVAGKLNVPGPGVLGNDDGHGLPLTASLAAPTANPCTNVTLNADGSFSATSAAPTCSFSYIATNSVGVPSAPTTVSLSFGAPSGLNVTVVDSVDATAVADYRWIIQEDLTYKVDPTQTPALGTDSLAVRFHKSYMPVVASGCVGAVSCGSGQSVRGAVVSDAAALLQQTLPSAVALDPAKHYYISILPGDAGAGTHTMGGQEFSVVAGSTPTWPAVSVKVAPAPLIPAQLSVYIYEDNAPTNGQNDLNETGLGGFNIIVVDAVGRSGDPAGQQTYDASGMPLSNWLLGRPGCPDDRNKNTNGTATSATGNLVGVIYTCPNMPAGYTGPAADYALAGHALIKNLTPARYDILAHPGAEREGQGEVWWQTETLEGTQAQDAFTGVKEPVYFQEFGPPGFHTTIGFVNPDRVKAASLNGLYTVSGKITNQRMSRPSDVRLFDSGSYDLLASTTCQVALNSQGGNGPAVAIASCAQDGSFTLTGVAPGSYQVVIWDQWLDQIIQTQAVTVASANVAMGNIPVLSWFTQYDQNIFLDTNSNGVYDGNETGISNVVMTTRYRDGGISNQTATDSNGNGLLAELFPLFNWYVTEADTTRFKQTGVTITVDGGGQVDAQRPGAPTGSSSIYSSTYADGTPSTRVELPGAYSYGLQGYISQRSTINWGRAPYAQSENGGIQGVVVYSTTRPFDDQRANVQTIWEPLVPRVTVNLYRRDKLADGTVTLTKVDSTQTSSWDDWVSAVDPATGKQLNMSCPGQLPAATGNPPYNTTQVDPFVNFTLQNNVGGNLVSDPTRCYDGFHNWNQVQAAPYDGRYQFPSSDYVKAHPLSPAQQTAGQTLVSLPAGEYVVEAVTPTGYEVVKEEDKNILNGDVFAAQVQPQFGGITNIFILPDQATLNNANTYNPANADGIQNNATTDLGVTTYSNIFPECVGSLHRVPDYLSLFPAGGLVSPFAGMDRPLCDRKLVKLGDQMQASANFFVFTAVPTAAAGTGIILDDASAEFNAASPDFGEKASVPFVPVSIKDFNGREISRAYSDQWGTYNAMMPSSWLVNPPTPSGYGPNMLVTCMNDPGPIPEIVAGVATGKMITDPQYNAAYSNFCYTIPFMPGRTTYLDTPVLPIAAHAGGYNPTDCSYPDTTPAIARVDSSAGFGPYLPAAGGTLTITALGAQQVPNPAYAGPFAVGGPAAQRTITRNYSFGTAKGTVKIGNVDLSASAAWADGVITVTVPAGTPSGQLVITNANGAATVDAVTVTVEDRAPQRVAGPSAVGDLPGAIQKAVDAAQPGDLILVDAGTYSELVVMWKPVRLQGVGAASVIVNATKYPTRKLDLWRPMINSLFAVDTVTGNQIGTSQVDPLPGQEITGGIVLLEPSVLGTEEGAGITVLAKNLPAGQCANGAPTTFTPSGAAGPALTTDSNFLCAASRIDGLSVTGGDAGGGIYVNGWAHNLEIANNRVYGNAGAFNGGVRIGIPYLEIPSFPGLTENVNGGVTGTPTVTVAGTIAGWGFDNNVKVHHNAITKNGVVEGPAGGGGAGGGISMCTGSDGYSVDHNWVCGNFSSSDGGGIGHIGFSQNGKIANNQILFNQSFQQTSATHGGGIAVVGEPALFGASVSPGTGNLSIDANLVRGNFAEAGHGGGIRLQQVNGGDIAAFPGSPALWHKVAVTNNMIVNNEAGYAGGGISLLDTLLSSIVNNTVASNDSLGIAGTILQNNVTGVAGVGRPSPAGISADPTSAQLAVLPNASALPAAQRAISNPQLVNNIVWQNRSFYYSGDNRICASNNGNTSCTVLPDQATTGQCVSGAAYWDLGVLGDTSPTPGAQRLVPSYSVLTSTAGYATNNNSANDPQLLDMYCNGSRVTPEFGNVINPPSVKNLQVASVLDEGNNYVSLRFGPLSVVKPTSPAGTAYAAFGDYHLNAGSPAKDSGTSTGAPNHDYDGRGRPQGTAYDRGAHEIAQVGASPSQLNFGNQPIHTTSAAQLVTVSNPTAAALAVGPLSLTGANAVEYAYLSACPASLPAGQSCTIGVSFTPSLLGVRTANLAITTGAGPFTVALTGTGTGPAYSVAPLALTFPNTLVGTSSAAQTVTVTNNQATPLTLTQRALGGLFPNQYAIAAGSTCSTANPLAAGGTCLINVSFRPVAVLGLGGVRPASLNLSAAGLATSVTLNGTAILSLVDVTPKGALGINGSLAFPDQVVGSTSTALVATLTNYQSTPVTFNSATSPGAPFTVVTGANACTNGAAVAANGGTCTLSVVFAPTARNLVFGVNLPWLRTFTLNLSGAGGANPTVTLTGLATVPTYAVTSGVGTGAVNCSINGFTNATTCTDAFPTNTPAGGTVTQTLTVTNPGAGAMTITSLPAITGQNTAGVFSVLTGAGNTTCTSGATVAAGSSCTVVVRMTVPSLLPATNRTGSLTVATSAATQAFALSGR